MKYLQTIDIINETIERLQKDINDNPIKYLKKNKFNEKIFIEKLNYIEKSIHGCWMEKSDLKFLTRDNKIKILNGKGNKLCNFYLCNDKGKTLAIINKINVNYIINNDNVNLIFEFQVDGDYLDFKHIFNIKRTLAYEIDISSIGVYLLLTNPNNKTSTNEYKVYRW